MLFTNVFVEYKSSKKSNLYIQKTLSKTSPQYLKEFSFVVVDNSIDNENYEKLSTHLNKNYIEIVDDNIYIRKVIFEYNGFIIPIFYVKNVSNSGYGAGNNLGVKIAKKHLNPKFVIISNNDIYCIDTYIDYNSVLTIFDSKDDVAVIGVNIENLDGSKQNPQRFVPFFNRWIIPELLFPLNRKFKNSGGDLIENAKTNYVYRLRGTFIFINTDIFLECGGFDENIFLYCEEPILAERLLKKKYKMYYYNDIHMIHDHTMDGSSITSSEIKKIKQRFKSEIYYYRNYIKVSGLSIFVAKMLFPFLILKYRIFFFLRKKKKKG